MGRKTLAERRARDAARKAELANDTTIGGRIFERSKGIAGTDADWFANELYTDLLDVAEQ